MRRGPSSRGSAGGWITYPDPRESERRPRNRAEGRPSATRGQLARERLPNNPTPLLSRMTVAFAAGQILGPLLVRAIGPGLVAGWDALAWANAAATVLLIVSAAWLWRDSNPPPSTLTKHLP